MSPHRVLVAFFTIGMGISALQGCSASPAGDEDEYEGRFSLGNCVPGGFYCGGDKVEGARQNLYQCESGKKGRLVARCATGCQINSGKDDACKPMKECVPGGTYCGGDKVNGDPDTLYECVKTEGGGLDTVFRNKCGGGCEVRPGQDDACKPALPCAEGGTYCGGDKVDGDPTFIYRCKAGGVAAGEPADLCISGCSVSPPGKDDVCKPSGTADYFVYSSSCAEKVCPPLPPFHP